MSKSTLVGVWMPSHSSFYHTASETKFEETRRKTTIDGKAAEVFQGFAEVEEEVAFDHFALSESFEVQWTTADQRFEVEKRRKALVKANAKAEAALAAKTDEEHTKAIAAFLKRPAAEVAADLTGYADAFIAGTVPTFTDGTPVTDELVVALREGAKAKAVVAALDALAAAMPPEDEGLGGDDQPPK